MSILLAIWAFLLSLFLHIPQYNYLYTNTIPIKKYQIVIKPKHSDMQTFLIEYKFETDKRINKKYLKEEFSNSFNDLSKDNYLEIEKLNIKEDVVSNSLGWMLKELSIFPLNLTSHTKSQISKQINLQNDNFFTDFYWRNDRCLESTVKLVDFPKGSFYESRESVNFKRDSYLDKDILSWSSCDLEQGIKFAYIPPPYNNFGKLIKLFSWFHSAENYLLFFFGSGVAFTFSSKVKTFLRRINPVINVQTVAIARSQSMTGNRNINTGGGNYNERIERDYIQGNYYAAGQPQSLAQAAADIQLLLKQLEQTYPSSTTSQQMVVAAEAINRIESNPTLKIRVINAVKEGGLAAFEKAIDNPAGAFIVGAIKGWQEVEAED
jgi:hypothetical protein